MEVSARFRRGVLLHQQGKLVEAQCIYEELLTNDPRHVASLHLLGILAIQTRELERGIDLLTQAISIKPDLAEAYTARGNAFNELLQFEEAISSFDSAIAIKPRSWEANCNRGVSLKALKRLDEAVASFDRAIAIKPDYAEAYCNRGNALSELGRSDEAIADYQKAIAIKSAFFEAFFNLGAALNKVNRFDEALENFDRAIEIAPTLASAYLGRGESLKELKRYDEALASYNQAINLKPEYAEAYSNRGNVLYDARSFNEAVASYDQALALKPDLAEAYSNRGDALNELGQFDGALASYDNAISIKQDLVDAHLNKGLCLLLTGCLEEGWPLYEWRKKKLKLFPSYPQPLWLGDVDISGKTLFVYWEQGLGDTIQFLRYVKLAEENGGKVVFSVQDSLIWLAKQLSPTIEVIRSKSEPGHFDYHIPLLSMPFAFKTTLSTIPAEIPYLHASRDRVDQWKQRIGHEGFKIGVFWGGSEKGASVGRSFPLSQLRNISRLPNIRLISLQKIGDDEQSQETPEKDVKLETFGADFDAGPDAFIDTAAIIETLDLIISSDSAVAHLAGALGRPTWVAHKSVPHWVWGVEGSATPWYPTLRLYRQNSPGDWKNVFEEMESALRPLIALGNIDALTQPTVMRSPIIPVSWGELIDKITILEIKSAKITVATALENVRNELFSLSKIVRSAAVESRAIETLRVYLKSINQELWTVEDKIRESERDQRFDREFIELARSVYRLNDQRAALKRRINIALSSELVEEKSYQDYS